MSTPLVPRLEQVRSLLDLINGEPAADLRQLLDTLTALRDAIGGAAPETTLYQAVLDTYVVDAALQATYGAPHWLRVLANLLTTIQAHEAALVADMQDTLALLSTEEETGLPGIAGLQLLIRVVQRDVGLRLLSINQTLGNINNATNLVAARVLQLDDNLVAMHVSLDSRLATANTLLQQIADCICDTPPTQPGEFPPNACTGYPEQQPQVVIGPTYGNGTASDPYTIGLTASPGITVPPGILGEDSLFPEQVSWYSPDTDDLRTACVAHNVVQPYTGATLNIWRYDLPAASDPISYNNGTLDTTRIGVIAWAPLSSPGSLSFTLDRGNVDAGQRYWYGLAITQLVTSDALPSDPGIWLCWGALG